MQMIQVVAPSQPDRVTASAARIFVRELADYSRQSVLAVARHDGKSPAVALETDATMPAESFRIVRESDTLARIIGGDARGVLYGCGRFLRRCRFEEDNVVFPESEAVSTPGKPFRGMYFAVHLHNFYHAAPLDVVIRYVEQLALWGINSLFTYYHPFHYNGINDPACREFIDRLNALYDAARAVGMTTGILVTANDGYLNSPRELRYVGEVPRNWGAELCPHKSGATELIRRQFAEVFEHFTDIDYLNLWPYDSGGCLCEKCRPWGVNGYYAICEAVAAVFREKCPGKKIVLSTWMFDYNCGECGEWDAFYERLRAGRLDWADLIMADGAYVNGYFPQRVIDEPIGKPVINFTDISMRTGCPWGSFGANPMPAFLQEEWNRIADTIDGGTPYSEGIFEDINKFIWAQLCWSPKRSVRDIVREYCASEVSPDQADVITGAIVKIEKVGRREPLGWTGSNSVPQELGNRLVLQDTTYCEEVWRMLERVDRALPLHRRRCWRWRLLLLRSLIDVELARSGGAPTPALGRAYDELFEIFHVTDDALWYIRPYEVEQAGDGSYRFAQHGWKIADILTRDIPVDEMAMAEA